MERAANLFHEQDRLLEGGEVAAPVEFLEEPQIRVIGFAPAPGRPHELAREVGDPTGTDGGGGGLRPVRCDGRANPSSQ